MNPILTIATRAARQAGNIITRALDQRYNLHIEAKGHHDFVSEVDRNAEMAIIRILREKYPDHAILAEEDTVTDKKTGSDYEWIIDPLDGTTNFLHGNPQFSISIALRYKGRLEHALVYDPLRDEMYTATRGEGAHLNNQRIRVTAINSIEGALLGTGFPFRTQYHLDAYLAMFKALFPHAIDVRRAGSAALDLAYVAAGRLDGFWEIGLNTWDMAGGVLLIQEAGGLVSDFGGGHDYLQTGNIVAGNPKVLRGILQYIRPHLTQSLKK